MNILEVLLLYSAIIVGFWKIVESIGGNRDDRNDTFNTTNRSSSSPNKRLARRLKKKNTVLVEGESPTRK